MAVKGLASMQDQYMIDILTMDLPGKNRVVVVKVEITWVTEGMFVAIAELTHKDGPKKYSAHGASIEEALLELAAEIIINYPVGDNEQADIDIAVAKIVSTKTFVNWFNTNQ